MTEGLHDPRPIQDALAATRTAKYIGKACASCGDEPTGDEYGQDFHLYVLPVTNSVHPTPQLTPLCDGCAMEIAEALSEMHDP